jgi:DNA-binding transcriptional LysR family regulator
MVLPLDLALVQAFVAVAEEEHVGRAALRLNISSSPLSRQIRRLEEDLGTALFHRLRQRLRLTEDGRSFLEEARALLAHAEAVRTRTSSGGDGTLSIGCSQNAVLDGTVMAAVASFRRAEPRATVRLATLRSTPQIERLRQGAIDIAFLNTPPDEPETFTSRLVGDDPFVLALPASHPLATAERIDPADLNGQPWFALDRTVNPAFGAAFMKACGECGFQPDIRALGSDLLTGIAVVEAGIALCLMQASLGRWPLPKGVVLRPLPGFPLSVRTTAVWRRDDPSPTLRRFLRHVEAAVADR